MKRLTIRVFIGLTVILGPIVNLVAQSTSGEAKLTEWQREAADVSLSDSARAQAMLQLARHWRWSQPESAVAMGKRAETLFQRAGLESQTLEALDAVGLAFLSKGLVDSSFAVFQRQHDHAQTLGNRMGIANALTRIGMVYEHKGDLQEALQQYTSSARLKQGRADTLDLVQSNLNIGGIFQKTGELRQALEYFDRAVDLARKAELITTEALISKASIHRGLGQTARALELLREAGKNLDSHDLGNITQQWHNALGSVFTSVGETDSALIHYQLAETFSQGANPKHQFETERGLAEMLLRKGDSNGALLHAKSALALADRLQGAYELRDAHHLLSQIYENLGDYRNALMSQRIYKSFSDSLVGSEQRTALDRVNAYFEFEQEKDVMGAIQSARLSALEQQVGRFRRLTIGGMVLLLAAVYISVFVMNRTAEKKRINQLLEKSNREIKTQKEALERQKVILDELNRLKDRLLAVISSDLRGPLSKMSSAIVMIRNRMLSEEETEKVLAELETMAESNMRLLDNLLAWARRQWRGTAVERKEFELLPLVDDALADLQEDIKLKKIQFNIQVDPNLKISADRAMIAVVIFNLISNAVKYSFKGGKVTVVAQSNGSATVTTVADEGVGIPKDKISKIFTSDSETTKGTFDEHGSGLGLIICRDFVVANDGSIEVESAPGLGTKFTMILPGKNLEEIRILETSALAN